MKQDMSETRRFEHLGAVKNTTREKQKCNFYKIFHLFDEQFAIYEFYEWQAQQ